MPKSLTSSKQSNRREIVRFGMPRWRKRQAVERAKTAGQSLSDWVRDCVYRCLDVDDQQASATPASVEQIHEIQARLLRVELQFRSAIGLMDPAVLPPELKAYKAHLDSVVHGLADENES